MRKLIGPDGHATQAALRALSDGSLNPEEREKMTEHIANCKLCAFALAETVGMGRPDLVPAGFEEETMNRISRSEEDRAVLRRFSFRVVLSACAALFLVFSGTWGMLWGTQSPFAKIGAPSFAAIEKINDHLRDFSQQILNMEALQDAKKAK